MEKIMKKVLLSLTLLLMPVLMFGCQKSISLEDCISEITKIYFSAESESVVGNISIGEREDPYIIDGTHTKNCDFSLISLKFDELLPSNQIEVDLNINNVSSKLILELNPANHFYMADLGCALKGNDVIQLTYQNFTLYFENISDSFVVDYNQALKIGQEALGDKIDKYYNNDNFNGEGYLKVLTKQEGDSKELFWVFTVVSSNGSKNNVVLSVSDGKVIISE